MKIRLESRGRFDGSIETSRKGQIDNKIYICLGDETKALIKKEERKKRMRGYRNWGGVPLTMIRLYGGRSVRRAGETTITRRTMNLCRVCLSWAGMAVKL